MTNKIEVEYKYWAGDLSKSSFHSRVENAAGKIIEPAYVCSCDDYYIRENNGYFLRYRKGGGESELTLKEKREGNVVRKEINLNMTSNDDSSIVEFLEMSGYNKAFSVFKEAWVFHFNDCDVSYYTLSDNRSVIEIEAVNYQNTKDALDTLQKWSKLLMLDSLNRETRSLFEIFTDERDEEPVKFGDISWQLRG